jgi:EmrB/QacA subfamily drug resistance transporter
MPTHPRAWLILALILCAEVMDLLDSTIVTVAAPAITADLHSNTTALQWVTGGYSLTFAVFLIAGARLGDRYGRKKLFLVGAWSFVAFSAVCALAPTTEVLVGGRLLQGVAAALLIPQGFSLLLTVFAAQDQGKAFAIFGPVVGLAAVAGPVIGGLLVDADVAGTGWRLVFLINLPIGVLAAVGATRLFPESRQESSARLDPVGILLVGATAALFTYPLIQGREAGWPAWTYAMIAGGLVVLAALVWWTRRRLRRGEDPLVQPSIFRRRGFSAGVVLTLVFFGGTFGVGLALTLFLQLGLGFSAVHAGLTALPYALGSSVGALFGAGLLAPRLGRNTLQLGNALQALGLVAALLVLARTGTHVTTLQLAGPLLVWGLGMGLVIAPLFDFVLASLTEDEAGSGSGVLNALQQLGSAIGVAAIGSVFFSAPNHVAGLEHSFEAGLGIAVAVCLLTFLLPRHSRDPQESLPDQHQLATASS